MSDQDILHALKAGAHIIDAANDAPQLDSGEAVTPAFFLALRLDGFIRPVRRGDPVIWAYNAAAAPLTQEGLWHTS